MKTSKNRSYSLIALGIILLLFSITLIQINLLVMAVPAILGIVYMILGVGLVPMNDKIRILIVYSAMPIVAYLGFKFDEYIMGSPRDATGARIFEAKSFWYNANGVCTEGTSCWLVGQIGVYALACISVIVGIIKLLLSFTKKNVPTNLN